MAASETLLYQDSSKEALAAANQPTDCLSILEFSPYSIRMNSQPEHFKPCYTWPNEYFYFNHYFDSETYRIFIIENIAHNWEWLHTYRDRIRPTDFFFVRLGWFFHDWLVEECRRCVNSLGIPTNQFRIMFNDYASKSLFEDHGFSGKIINHNAFLDYNLFEPRPCEKIYDAIYTARHVPFKRHHLCQEIPNLALITGPSYSVDSQDKLPAHVYRNNHVLNEEEVREKISASHVGLILSEIEGACYASSEYLLMGIPVVSTFSHGGRDIWYNDYNSIICAPDAGSIAQAVAKLKNTSRDQKRIRQMHKSLSDQMRLDFCALHEEVASESGNTSIDPRLYFQQSFFHKMMRTQKPDFDQIFS